MAQMPVFKGFPKDIIPFLEELKAYNSKVWFEENRDRFNESVLEPAKAFIDAMGLRLGEFSSHYHALAKVDGSIFRLHRDVRFSKDKSPYKTHLGMFIWEGGRPKMECPGLYVHIEPPTLFIGGGLYRFPKPLLLAYRDSVMHPKHGEQLVEIIDELRKWELTIGGEFYKRVPSGFDKEHERADLLKYAGLHAGVEVPLPRQLHTGEFVEYVTETYRPILPLHRWLLEMIQRA